MNEARSVPYVPEFVEIFTWQIEAEEKGIKYIPRFYIVGPRGATEIVDQFNNRSSVPVEVEERYRRAWERNHKP